MQSSNQKVEGTYYKGDGGGRGGNFSRRDRHQGGKQAGETPNISRDAPTQGDGNHISVKSEVGKSNCELFVIPTDDLSVQGTESPIIPKKSNVKSYHTLNLRRLNWETYHSAGCKHGCRNEQSHYKKWREAYEEHLWDMYIIFTSSRINLSKINYNLFTVFVYNNSSRFISEFA